MFNEEIKEANVTGRDEFFADMTEEEIEEFQAAVDAEAQAADEAAWDAAR